MVKKTNLTMVKRQTMQLSKIQKIKWTKRQTIQR
jgi:hypothetical protein